LGVQILLPSILHPTTTSLPIHLKIKRGHPGPNRLHVLFTQRGRCIHVNISCPVQTTPFPDPCYVCCLRRTDTRCSKDQTLRERWENRAGIMGLENWADFLKEKLKKGGGTVEEVCLYGCGSSETPFFIPNSGVSCEKARLELRYTCVLKPTRADKQASRGNNAIALCMSGKVEAEKPAHTAILSFPTRG
jgi:hypothetical protein